eukprot:TRINITY_DN4629_c0_g1_i2.p2 TRINITY_DN4629_c0_g1~~TRINITY_DN4629_c0_g1_i2.p2  ORF type:complete len:149 (-),score=48.39 TRINITY_DN4629_c0_g1_i2:682-1128(-)
MILGNNPGGHFRMRAKLDFSAFDRVMEEVQDDPETIFVVGFGVEWCFPSFLMLRSLQNISKEGVFTGMSIAIIDQEESAQTKQFCLEEKMLIGSAAIMVYHQAQRLSFVRSDWDLDDKLVGVLDEEALHDVLAAVYMAVRNHEIEVEV